MKSTRRSWKTRASRKCVIRKICRLIVRAWPMAGSKRLLRHKHETDYTVLCSTPGMTIVCHTGRGFFRTRDPVSKYKTVLLIYYVIAAAENEFREEINH